MMESNINHKVVSIFDLRGIEKLNYAKTQLAIAQNANDEIMAKYWRDTIYNINLKLDIKKESTVSVNVPSQEHFQSIPKNEQLAYARKQFELAQKNSDDEIANFWLNVIEGLSIEENDKENTVKPNSLTHTLQKMDAVEKLYARFVEELSYGKRQTAEIFSKNIKDILKADELVITPISWESLNDEDRLRFMKLKAIMADIEGQKEEYDYWTAFTKRMTLDRQQNSQSA